MKESSARVDRDPSWLVLLDEGILLHKNGDLLKAIDLYLKVLRTETNQPDTLRLLSMAYAQIGRYNDAIITIELALTADSTSAAAYSVQGDILQACSRDQDALNAYEQALKLESRLVDAWANRGNLLQKLNRTSEAEVSYQKALELNPRLEQVWSSLGCCFQKLGKFDDAKMAFSTAISLNASYAPAFSNLANLTLQQGNPAQALEHVEDALRLDPNFSDAYCTKGNILLTVFRVDEALESYSKALELSPRSVSVLSNRAVAFMRLNQIESAEKDLDLALQLNPNFTDAIMHRGNLLQLLNRYQEALACYQEALKLAPNANEILINMTAVLVRLRQFEKALSLINEVLARTPEDANAHGAKSMCLLTMCNYPEGFASYEWRWKCQSFNSPQRHTSLPMWTGSEPLYGKTLLIHDEQGFGDTIQFCRYALIAQQYGATVLLEVKPPLVTLMRELSPKISVFAQDTPLPSVDFQLPIMSSGIAFKTTFSTVPWTGPYVRPPEESVNLWASRIPFGSALKIGLVWAGNPIHLNDRNRSISLEFLYPLLEHHYWISLQNLVSQSDAQELERRANVCLIGNQIQTFSDTAAIIHHLDLVITVDTAVAHLAGAMGKPVWILLPYAPDWRWGVASDITPWYPTAKLFRQPVPGDWNPVILQVKKELSCLV